MQLDFIDYVFIGLLLITAWAVFIVVPRKQQDQPKVDKISPLSRKEFPRLKPVKAVKRLPPKLPASYPPLSKVVGLTKPVDDRPQTNYGGND